MFLFLSIIIILSLSQNDKEKLINMFVDRNEEIDALNRIYKHNAALVIIYGRRRIGKTELINQFIEGKPSAYIVATKEDENTQLQKLARKIGQIIKDRELISYGVTSWDMLFDKISLYKGRLVVAIDEFPYLIQGNRSLTSIFQAGWDQYLSKSNSMLILSGSSISMMQEEVLNYSAPLYGRSSLVLNLMPMRFKDVIPLMHEGMKFVEKLYTYFIFGGIPAYYKITVGNSLNKIIELIIADKGFFLNELSIILAEEVKNDERYTNIIRFIGNGISKPKELADKMHIPHSNLDRYLKVLDSIGLIEKEYPITTKTRSKRSKKSIIKLKDPYLYFWSTTLDRYKELIEKNASNAKDLIIKSIELSIAPKLFEEFSKEFIFEITNKKMIFQFTDMGRWWGKDPAKDKSMNQEEIDIVALNDNTEDILFGECKWTNSKVDTDLYYDLQRKSKLVQWNNNTRKEHFVLFSKSGFTTKMIRLAKDDDVLLFDLDAIEKALG